MIFLLFFFIIRFSVEFIVFVKKADINFNFYPLFHYSIMLEGVVLICFYLSLLKTRKLMIFLLLLPLLYFLIETKFIGSISSPCRIGNLGYNLTAVILFFDMIIVKKNQLNETTRKVCKVLFLYHCIAFTYTLFIPNLRTNVELMKLVYPAFFIAVILLNITISKILLCRKPTK